MKQLRIAALVMILAATPSLAGKVYIDYDKDADWDKFESWDYRDNPDGKVGDPLMQKRLEDGLLAMMQKSSLKRDESNPDLLVTFSVTSEERTQYNTVSSGMGYGYPGGWGGYGGYGYGGYGGGMGMASSTTYETTYTDGTIVVDAWDPDAKSLLWRGSATETLKAKPNKIAQQIDKMYTKMWSRWEKMQRDVSNKK